MSRILTSLHGRKLGLGSAESGGLQPLIAPGGLILGEHGTQRQIGGPNHVAWFDDFLGDALDARYSVVEGTDSATSDAAILATASAGGWLRMTTGDAGTGLAADLIQVNLGSLQWAAANGGLDFEIRFKMSAITECYAFLGFTDVVTLEAPIISAASADTFTTTASDAVGIMFDTRMTTDNWWLTGVAANVDATHQNSGFAPVAATFETWRIEVSAAGAARFMRNGKPVGVLMNGAVTPATALVPTIGFGKLSTATSITADIDYIHVAMVR
jgi:hypothetical protein